MSKMVFIGLALLAGLAVALTVVWSDPVGPTEAEEATPSLSATFNQADWSIALTLSDGPTDWWYTRTGSVRCYEVSGNTVKEHLPKPRQYTFTAYSDGGCSAQLATTTVTVPTPTLTATVNDDRSVDLTLSNGPANWWFKINGGACVSVNETTFSNIRGYGSGTYNVKVYLAANCVRQLTETSFTIPTASLTATVNNDRSVDLAVSDAPSNWWFRIGWGDCTAASGTAYNNIRGYGSGTTHHVKAYSDSGCGYQFAATTFTIPTASLAATFNQAAWSTDLTISNGPDNWWFKINWSGACVSVSGTTYSGIGGYGPGTHHVKAYSGNGCGYQIAETTFTVPSTGLAAAVNDDRSVDLTLSDGPANWWYKINWSGGCTSASGTTVSNIRGYQAGTHHVIAYSGSGCSHHIAETTFTMPTVSLAATVNDDRSVDLAVSGAPSNWWFKINNGGCTSASGTTFSNIRGYGSGTYSVKAYSDSGCGYQFAETTFTVPTASLAAAFQQSDWSIDLTVSDAPSNWWFKINGGTCTSASGTTYNNIRGYGSGTHGVKAYSDSGCGYQFAQATVTVPSASLSATFDNTDWSTVLTLTNGPDNWWYKGTDLIYCESASNASVTTPDLRPGEKTFRAYAGNGCGGLIAVTTFTIAAPSLSATVNSDQTVNLTLTNGPTNWWYKIDGGDCTSASGTTVSNVSVSGAGDHSVKATLYSYCIRKLAETTFTTQ